MELWQPIQSKNKGGERVAKHRTTEAMDAPELLYVAKKRVFEMVGRKEINLVLQSLQSDILVLKEISDRAMEKLESTGEIDEELLDEIVDSIV